MLFAQLDFMRRKPDCFPVNNDFPRLNEQLKQLLKNFRWRSNGDSQLLLWHPAPQGAFGMVAVKRL
jgi:hypothetical protein